MNAQFISVSTHPFKFQYYSVKSVVNMLCPITERENYYKFLNKMYFDQIVHLPVVSSRPPYGVHDLNLFETREYETVMSRNILESHLQWIKSPYSISLDENTDHWPMIEHDYVNVGGCLLLRVFDFADGKLYVPLDRAETLLKLDLSYDDMSVVMGWKSPGHYGKHTASLIDILDNKSTVCDCLPVYGPFETKLSTRFVNKCGLEKLIKKAGDDDRGVVLFEQKVFSSFGRYNTLF